MNANLWRELEKDTIVAAHNMFESSYRNNYRRLHLLAHTTSDVEINYLAIVEAIKTMRRNYSEEELRYFLSLLKSESSNYMSLIPVVTKAMQS